jgi:hypothetical protein
MRWPSDKGGHYFFGDERIYFLNNNIRYNIKDLAPGYCTPTEKNGCVYVLKKDEQLLGKLPIKDFVVLPEVYMDKSFSPKLHYPYAPHFCAN